jgi:hypothetical protein
MINPSLPVIKPNGLSTSPLLVNLAADKSMLLIAYQSLPWASKFSMAIYFPILQISIANLLSHKLNSTNQDLLSLVKIIDQDNPITPYADADIEINSMICTGNEYRQICTAERRALMHFILVRSLGDFVNIRSLLDLHISDLGIDFVLTDKFQNIFYAVNNALMAMEGKLKYVKVTV